MKLTGSQIAAGIALSGMTQKQLAQEAHLGPNTLTGIINGNGAYRESTITKIRDILEMRGIEFLPAEGVRKKDRMVSTYDGEGAQKNLLNDVYDTLKNTGGEVLISHVDESIAIGDLSGEFLEEHLKRLKAAKITERMLVRAGDQHIVTGIEDYRAIPEKYFIATPMFIYGDKLALMSWSPAPRAVILQDARFAESARRLFNFAWDNAASLTAEKRREK